MSDGAGQRCKRRSPVSPRQEITLNRIGAARTASEEGDGGIYMLAGNPTSLTGSWPLVYNTQRPHRALKRHTAQAVYDAGVKASPTRPDRPHYRVRTDKIDPGGHLSLRRAGRMHHLGVGRAHARKTVTILVDARTVTVLDQTTGEILSEHTIDPSRNYWRNTNKGPGRWPGP